MKLKQLALVAVLIYIVCEIPTIFAQDTQFGKNKVQYKNFDWYFVQSAHFDIYFNKGGESLAEFTANVAESAYTSISKSFRYQIAARIPIIVYNSHNDFQQTNVVYDYLEEGIGGVTELFKNRIVVPFEGDYKKFRHVIHHELVHGVINDMFYGGTIQSIISNNITIRLPLWFNEGLAEYEALKWDTHSDMFIRDATVHEYLPKIENLYGYFAYRCGQSVWYYIATKYGEQKIAEILTRIKGTRNVDQGFRSAIRLSVEELSDRWQKEQKVLYWPDIAKREEPADFARRLTDHKKDGSFYNTSPAISPRGDRIAFISNRDDYFDVFIMNAIDGRIEKKLIKGQRTADFEELHLLTPGMSWSPDGKHIALAAKSGGQDVIIIIDVYSGSEGKFNFDLDGIFSVDWSPVDSSDPGKSGKLAFVGNKNNQSDIYVFDLDTKSLTNLTDDIFSDADPSWSSDGKAIYFASDRRDYLAKSSIPLNFKMQNYDYRQLDIYQIDISSQNISMITNLPNSDETSPVAATDGKHLYFISDMNGINNIYIKNLDSGNVRPLTNSLSGVYQLSLTRDGNKLAFNSLNNAGFDLFLMRNPLDRDLKQSELEPTEYFKRISEKNISSDTTRPTKADVILGDNIIVKMEKQDSLTFFPDAGRVELRNYVFSDAFREKSIKASDSVKISPPADNVDEQGNYKINKYKLNFSPDIIYGNAGYNTFYGIQGSTIMAFSDMLGDHQFIILMDLQIDLNNSDYALAYFYLPKRIDYGIQGFHTAQFIYLSKENNIDSLYRFRNYGLLGTASYPFNKFNRIDFGLAWYNISQNNISAVNSFIQRRTVILPSVSYVHDHSLWGFIAPANGARYNLSLMTSPKLSDRSLGFITVLGDYRHYYKLWKNYTLALRFAGGASFGPDPQQFMIGGVNNWINRRFERGEFPIQRAEDFAFLTLGVPLRGYNFNARLGYKYGLMNTEFRFPLFGYFAAGPLPVFFQSFSGVLFLDMGGAWKWRKDFQAFAKDENGSLYMRDLLTGTGYGIRMIFLGFLLKMDVGWSFNLQHFSTPQYYFSLGADL
ncbi:MAG: biopolymer transporter Tol [Bacteroidota bacterium]|nr:biopolymer transporter Tol [Bacteroidota bacterium]